MLIFEWDHGSERQAFSQLAHPQAKHILQNRPLNIFNPNLGWAKDLSHYISYIFKDLCCTSVRIIIREQRDWQGTVLDYQQELVSDSKFKISFELMGILLMKSTLSYPCVGLGVLVQSLVKFVNRVIQLLSSYARQAMRIILYGQKKFLYFLQLQMLMYLLLCLIKKKKTSLN